MFLITNHCVMRARHWGNPRDDLTVAFHYYI